MKYRIIKHGWGNPYYRVQYVDSLTQEWKTIPQTYYKRRYAIRALRNIARAQIEEARVRVIEEDEL